MWSGRIGGPPDSTGSIDERAAVEAGQRREALVETGLPPAMRAIKGATYTLERSTSGRDAIVVTVSGSYWPVSTAIVDAFASRRNRG